MLHAVCYPPQRAVGLSGESLSRAQTRVRTAFATSLAASLAQLTRTVASDSMYAALFLADRPGHVSPRSRHVTHHASCHCCCSGPCFWATSIASTAVRGLLCHERWLERVCIVLRCHRHSACCLVVQTTVGRLETCLDIVCGGHSEPDVLGGALRGLSEDVDSLLPGIVGQAQRSDRVCALAWDSCWRHAPVRAWDTPGVRMDWGMERNPLPV